MTSGPWALDLIGGGAAEAKSAVSILAANGIESVAVDPGVWLARYLDQGSVEYNCDIARAALASGLLSSEQSAAAESMLEDCEEWLTANFDPERALRED